MPPLVPGVAQPVASSYGTASRQVSQYQAAQTQQQPPIAAYGSSSSMSPWEGSPPMQAQSASVYYGGAHGAYTYQYQ